MTEPDTTQATAPVPLRAGTLADLPSGVPVPRYDRSAVGRGIVHLGVGGFHRAHQAMYLDRLLTLAADEGDREGLGWGICGVGVLPHDDRIISTLRGQDGLYTLVVKHPDGRREARVIGSLVEVLHAPSDPQAVLDAMTDPATKIVSLTITEGGYLVNQATGELQADAPGLRADLHPGAAPSTAFGFVVAALRARREAGTAPFTVMSCDNLPGNGDVARRMMISFARLADPELADWMQEHVAFPNAMVDRITPVTAPEDTERLAQEHGVADGWPVVCEPFTQWVLEDRFPTGRPALERVGVQVVDDVEPYELMKLRLLNASHQALCYLGYLAGYRYAHEVCQDPLFVDFLLGYMEQEATPTLPAVPGTDLADYRHTLIERFANPEVRDTLARLCAESSDRIPKWLLPVVRHQLDRQGPIERAALVVAAWTRYAEGTDEQGEPIEVVDRLRDRVMAAAARQHEDPLAFLRDRELFGDLAEQDRFTAVYAQLLASLHEEGARATVAAVVRSSG
ncbi:mannitol dehydrogenase family protein [Ornithinicoccus halotolerans]|uniref:mannitol dehydrogenase family protein n=1 Tax=Ornithinicoccus halotolerans TaxID=1748220 RepID=UPI001E47C2F7|nr:mannitol dehydrogenase family protein [Ornithinicoccus halotolerans]